MPGHFLPLPAPGRRRTVNARSVQRRRGDLKRAFASTTTHDGLVSASIRHGNSRPRSASARSSRRGSPTARPSTPYLGAPFEGTGRLDTPPAKHRRYDRRAWVGWTALSSVDGRRIPVESLRTAAFPARAVVAAPVTPHRRRHFVSRARRQAAGLGSVRGRRVSGSVRALACARGGGADSRRIPGLLFSGRGGSRCAAMNRNVDEVSGHLSRPVPQFFLPRLSRHDRCRSVTVRVAGAHRVISWWSHPFRQLTEAFDSSRQRRPSIFAEPHV